MKIRTYMTSVLLITLSLTTEAKSIIPMDFIRIIAKQYGVQVDQFDLLRKAYKLNQEEVDVLKRTLSGKFDPDFIEEYMKFREKNQGRRAATWNEYISGAREEDLLSQKFSDPELRKHYASASEIADSAYQVNNAYLKKIEDFSTRYKRAEDVKESADFTNQGITILQDQNNEILKVNASILKTLAIEQQERQREIQKTQEFFYGKQ